MPLCHFRDYDRVQKCCSSSNTDDPAWFETCDFTPHIYLDKNVRKPSFEPLTWSKHVSEPSFDPLTG